MCSVKERGLLGQTLRAVRVNSGISLRAMSVRCGISTAQLSVLERAPDWPLQPSMAKYAAALGLAIRICLEPHRDDCEIDDSAVVNVDISTDDSIARD